MSAKLLPLGLLATLAGCTSGNLYQQPTGEDTAVTDTDTEEPGDTDTAPAEAACHPADPLDVATPGATRTYTVNYQGDAGDETQTLRGAGTTPDGLDAFIVESHLVTDTADLTVTSYRGCDANGGAILLGEMTTGTAEFELPFELPGGFGDFGDLFGGEAQPVQARRVISVPEPYLSDLATLRGTGTWTYSYELMVVGSAGGDMFTIPNCASPAAPPNEMDATCVPVEGTVTAYGEEEVTVGGQTYTAMRVMDEKTELWESAGGTGGTGGTGGIPGLPDFGSILGSLGFGSSTDVETISLKWYVEGIGLVKEQTYDVADPPPNGTPIMTRDLVSVTGLPQ